MNALFVWGVRRKTNNMINSINQVARSIKNSATDLGETCIENVKSLYKSKNCLNYNCIMPAERGSNWCDLHKCKFCNKSRERNSRLCADCNI